MFSLWNLRMGHLSYVHVEVIYGHTKQCMKLFSAKLFLCRFMKVFSFESSCYTVDTSLESVQLVHSISGTRSFEYYYSDTEIG